MGRKRTHLTYKPGDEPTKYMLLEQIQGNTARTDNHLGRIVDSVNRLKWILTIHSLILTLSQVALLILIMRGLR